MKTQLTSLFTRTAILLALLCWLVPANVLADVTAEWGDYGSPKTDFPSNTSSTIYGEIDVTLTTTLSPSSVSVGGNGTLNDGNHNAYHLSNGEYFDISISDGEIKSMGFALWTTSTDYFSLQFCSASTYNASYLLGDPVVLTGTDLRWQSSPTEVTSVPSGAKSARFSKVGNANWNNYVWRVIVTAAAACSPLTATFAAAGSETSGSAPSSKQACEGNNITIPDAGSLARTHYVFAGWSDGSNTYAEGASYTMPNHDVTFTAQWLEISLHQPGTYQAPVSEGGYGRVLKNKNGHDYEVYLLTYDEAGRACTENCDNNNGELYAGPVDVIHDGYLMFTGSGNTEAKSVDGWVAFKPYKYYGSNGSCNIDEFQKLNASSSISSSRYARIGNTNYIRLYVQGYDQFSFIGQDNSADNHFVIKIDGVSQAYTPDATQTNVTRFDLTTNAPHFIEITGSSSNTNSKFRGFSLRLPDVARYTVTAQNTDGYGTVSPTTISNVRSGEATYVSGNTVYIAGATITATPSEETTEYSYAFNNWTGVPATITAATTVTANFTRTPKDYTLTWNLNGGTVTVAGTGANVNATGTPSSTVTYGTVITVPTVSKEGCEFVGWDVTPSATMPAANTTYTARWFSPLLIPSNVTRLDADNVYLATSPGTSSFNVDGEGENETCLNIGDLHYAEWKAKITPGYYQATLLYGTTGYAVKVNISIIDESNDNVLLTTSTDIHSDGSGAHCCYLAKWGLDLRTLVDANKVYRIRVSDVYGSTGSHPQVGHIDFIPATPTAISNTSTTRLDYNNVTNPYTIVDFDIENDGVAEKCLFIGDNQKSEWLTTIKPDKYVVHVLYGKSSGSTNLTLSVLNESGTAVWTSDPKPLSSSTRYENWVLSEVDLSTLSEDAEYTVRITDTYNGTGSKPNIAHIDFKPQTVFIPTETRLDATNTISAVSFEDDLDIDDDGVMDNLMNLNKKKGNAEWMVQIVPGVYTVSLVYGVPAWGVKVSVKLIDPNGMEGEQYLSTNPYYYESDVTDGTTHFPHHHVGTTICDLTGLTPNKKYKVQVADEWDGNGCDLRVSHLEFTPIEPVEIPTVTRLDASNVSIAPAISASRIDIRNQQEAVWYAKIVPGIYDIALHYGVTAENCTKVRFGIIDTETGDTIFVHQKDKCSSGEETYSIEANNQDLRSVLSGDKLYKIIVKDNYKSNGSKPLIDYLEFEDKASVYLREGLRTGDYGTICFGYAVLAANISGANLYEIDEWAADGRSLTLTQLNADEDMVAGRPYIFRATASKIELRYYPSGAPAEAGEYNGLIGSYTQKPIAMNDDNYIIYNNKLYLVNSEAYVGANRAYIHKTPATTPSPVQRKRVTLAVEGGQVATGMDGVQNAEYKVQKVLIDGKLLILRDGKIYNAQGNLITDKR